MHFEIVLGTKEHKIHKIGKIGKNNMEEIRKIEVHTRVAFYISGLKNKY